MYMGYMGYGWGIWGMVNYIFSVWLATTPNGTTGGLSIGNL